MAPWVVCLAWSLEKPSLRPLQKGLAVIAATLFSLSVFDERFRVWGALPWLFLCLYRAFSESIGYAKEPHFRTGNLAILASTLYLPVGSIWALFDQARIQPLGFSGIIVLLTGVHFHYAGFALPRLTGLWFLKAQPTSLMAGPVWGMILGVPLVAIGITTSQLNLPPAIETISVTILATSALTVSVGQATWALRTALPLWPRFLLVGAGIALSAGMVLATLYGWRHFLNVSWATIPAMFAFHGTLNSLGFCLPGFLAWKILDQSPSTEL